LFSARYLQVFSLYQKVTDFCLSYSLDVHIGYLPILERIFYQLVELLARKGRVKEVLPTGMNGSEVFKPAEEVREKNDGEKVVTQPFQ